MFAVAGVVIGAVVGGVAGNYLDNKLNDAQTRKFLIQLWEEAHDNLSHGKLLIILIMNFKNNLIGCFRY